MARSPASRVIVVMISRLKFKEKGGVGRGLLPAPLTAQKINPLNQQIGARRLR